MLLSLVLSARAAEYTELLTQAKGSLLATEFVAARDLLQTAEDNAASSTSLISRRDLARLFFYRGVVYWRASPESSAMEAWRQALTIDPDFQPEADVLTDPAEQDVFRALRAEVLARGDIEVKLPEDSGESAIFIDGQKLEPTDSVVMGSHLVQIRCEGGQVVGSWYAYGAPPSNYLALCEGGSFKGGKGAKNKPTSSKADKPTKSDKPAKSEKPAKSDKPTGENKGEAGKNIAGATLLGLGVGGGVASAVLYLQAVHSFEVYDTKRDAARGNSDINEVAEDWYDDHVIPAYTRFYGATIASGVLLAAGATLIILDVDGPVVAPMPGGGMVGWQGRF